MQQTIIAESIRIQWTPISSNRKTGQMPVTLTTSNTCPTSCPLAGAGCYAGLSFTGINWRKLDSGERGICWSDFCQNVASLDAGTLWRHNEAGDLPTADRVNIDPILLGELVHANIGRKGFTYTHHDPMAGQNAHWIKAANDWGFTVNLSGNNYAHADQLAELGIAPVVCLMPEDAPSVDYTPAGRKVIECPADPDRGITCTKCRLCQRKDRPIIGFKPHGSQAGAVSRTIRIFSIN